MGSMAAVALIIATLTSDGNTAAPLHRAGASREGGDGLAAQERRPRRKRARRPRRPASPDADNNTPTPRPGPSDSPAHMAPQPEDIPPVKPPKKTPPPADKTNP